MSVAVDVAATPRERNSLSSIVDRTLAVRRLRKNAISLLQARPESVPLGDDGLVSSIAKMEGLGARDVTILRVAISGTRYTLVCVPHVVWHDEDCKPRLMAIRRRANQARRNCVLVPASFIEREPRLTNSRAINDALGVAVTMENRMAVLIHLVENGYSTLYDCANVIEHPNPFSCVLSMVAMGIIRMDLSKVMTPETRIDLADAA